MARSKPSKHEHTVDVRKADVRKIVEARNALYRSSFAPDPTINPLEVIRDLLGVLDHRITQDERREIAMAIDRCTPLDVSLVC